MNLGHTYPLDCLMDVVSHLARQVNGWQITYDLMVNYIHKVKENELIFVRLTWNRLTVIEIIKIVSNDIGYI